MKFITIVAIFLGVAGVSQAAAAGGAPAHHLIDRKYSWQLTSYKPYSTEYANQREL